MRCLLFGLNATLLLLILLASTACGGAASTYTAGPMPASSSGAASPPAAAAATNTSAPAVAPTTAAVPNPAKPNPATYQSPLMAGQVDDNAKFQDYLDYIHTYRAQDIHAIAVERRLFVRVVDGQQHPVAGARVQLFDGSRAVFDGRTVSEGRVLFFPQAADAVQATQLRAVVSRGQQKVEATVPADEAETTVSLPKLGDNTGPVGLDLVFLLDATGSMGDELATVNATVDSIADRIEQLPGSSRPRFGLVAFRDQGDDYVTRSWDFTADTQQFAANLSHVTAGGGGDYPESVNAGLHDAIHLPGWTPVDTGRHLRLIVLVGDAPPHLDYAQDYEYTSLLNEAVGAGIKIFPIAASGLNDQGEYIFRQFAQVTQGQFVFITYANGVAGAPGPATDHHVDDFTVHNLDGIVVNLVAGEIANQTGGSGQTGQADPDAQPGAGPLALDEPAPPAGAKPSGLGILAVSVAAQLWGWFNGGNLPLWPLLLAVVVWVGCGQIRARRAPAGQAFVGPARGASRRAPLARDPRAFARLTTAGHSANPAAQTLAPPAHHYAYITRTPARDTAPLPPLSEETTRLSG